MKSLKLVLAFIAGVAVAAGTVACADRSGGSFNADQVQQIQSIVHDYLVQHPEVLVEASQALQQKQTDQMRTQAVTATLANKQALFNAPVSPVGGNHAGTVTLVEFFDYQCPHCIDMAGIVDNLVKKDPNLRVVFKEFPIFGDVSDYAARAALASAKLGKYPKFHNALFAMAASVEGAHKRVTKMDVDKAAQKAGLTMAQLKPLMNSKAITDELKENRDLAGKLGLAGTPAFIVGYTDVAKDTDPALIGFVPGQTTEAQLQGLLDKLK